LDVLEVKEVKPIFKIAIVLEKENVKASVKAPSLLP
jgi:hypothetical protein